MGVARLLSNVLSLLVLPLLLCVMHPRLVCQLLLVSQLLLLLLLT